MKPLSQDTGYIKSLDGLRALAVLSVIFYHWPATMRLHLGFGWIGVNIFFVLSGFLITRILVKDKSKPYKDFISHFYIKRFLRIFPIYYLYLFLLFGVLIVYSFIIQHRHIYQLDVLHEVLMRNAALLLTYTFNFQSVINQALGIPINDSPFVAHLWSLSVEEQYYIVFPFLVFFLSPKKLKILLACVVIAIPFLRILFVEYFKAQGTSTFLLGLNIYKNTVFQIDSLALGGCLVLFSLVDLRRPARLFWILSGVMLFCGLLVLYAFRKGGGYLNPNTLGFDVPAKQVKTDTPYLLMNLRYAWQVTLVNFTSAALILACIGSIPFRRIFENNMLVFIGKISYGMYLYHYPILALMLMIVPESSIRHNIATEGLFLLLFLSLTVGVSWASFQLMERHFLKLKAVFIREKPHTVPELNDPLA